MAERASDRGWGSGWPSCQEEKIVGLTVNGVDFPGGVREETRAVLTWVARQFHERVENLRGGECWGFACREIAATNEPSNHSWGLALDFNAPSHPYGKSGTFSSGQVKEIHEICDGAMCRWGGDYQSTPDEMHIEFMGTPEDARRLGRELGESWTDRIMNELPILKKGSGGPNHEFVQSAQALLDVRHVEGVKTDGYFGEKTEQAVKRFQERTGLEVDGIVGPITWRRLMGSA